MNVLTVNAFSALATGGAVISGQYLGRRENGKAGHAGAQLILFMLEISLLLTDLFYAGKGFVLHRVFGHIEADVAAYANTYYMIVESSIPFLALYNAGAALFRVMGNSKVSMWVSTAMNLINAAGNAILIFGFRMGVAGVAIPTVVSRLFAAAAMIWLLGKPGLPLQVERFSLRHDRFIVRHILRFGVPNGLESSMSQLGRILLLSTVSVLGTASVAANAIAGSICNFQCIPGKAIGLALVTVVSQCIGAGSMEDARYYARKLLRMTQLYMAAVGAGILLFLPLILRLYNVSAEAEHYIRIISWLHVICGAVFWASSFNIPYILRAAGDTRFTMLVSSATMWILRVASGVVLCRYVGFGVLGIWFAMFADWIARACIYEVRFRGNRWENMGIGD